MKIPGLLTIAALLAGTPMAAGAPTDPGLLLRTIQAVGPQGAGHREAAQAWEQLVQADASQLPVILAGLDQAGPLAANWIRTAIDAIAERQLQRGGALPAAELERFVRGPGHSPRGRRLAYEWLLRVDPPAKDRLIPGMLNDPSLEMRRDAVARTVDDAALLEKEKRLAEAIIVYQRAMSAARDLDQCNLVADRLRKLGRPVDLARHFGYLVRWKLIGPFDNRGGKGFEAVYPPEREFRPEISYEGKHGAVKWNDYTSADEHGRVDLNKAIGEEKGVVTYAAAECVAERQQEVEFRMTSFNALKLWLNGELIGRYHVYHGGAQPDQYVSRGTLRTGHNTILVKVCQNEQTQDWARVWEFQLRVCDAIGGAVLSLDREKKP